MGGENFSHTISHQASYERASLSPAPAAISTPQSAYFARHRSTSIESQPNLPIENLNLSSTYQRSPSFPPSESGRASPMMSSRPARKTTAPGALDLELPVTYTPTTHRISKAKKGKKVHVCEYGCGKVFTRAEHRKRHEANHNTNPLFKCHIEGCYKPFQRVDLLNRHLERQHGIPLPPDGPRRRASSTASSMPDSISGSPVPTLAACSQTQSPALIGFTSSPITPSFAQSTFQSPGRMRAFSQPRSTYHEPIHMPLPESTRSFTPDYVHEAPTTEAGTLYAQTGFYTSDLRDTAVDLNYNVPYQKPTPLYATSLTSVPAIEAFGGFPQVVDGLGLDLGAQYQSQDVGDGSAESAGMDSNARPEHHGPQSTYVSNLASASSLVDLHEDTRRHYELCYWETVDPIFPILHYSSYTTSPPQLGLRDIVCAIGAQASPHPSARKHSIALFDNALEHYHKATGLLNLVGTPTEVLQFVFLFEYLALYRSRSPHVESSPRFTTLYTALLASHTSLNDRPEFFSQAIADDQVNYLHEYHRQWIDLESRRRLLFACFILDTQRQKLLEQRPSVPDVVATLAKVSKPSSQVLWTTTNPQHWHDFLCQQDESVPNTPFHCALAHAVSLHTAGTISLNFPPDILAYSLQLATQTRVRQLLITAAGSWLFMRKVSEPNWYTARSELRAWVGTQNATIAAWLAGKVLRAYFAAMSASQSATSQPAPHHSRPGIIRLETQWCLYLATLVLWAYTSPTSQPSTNALSSPPSSTFYRPNVPAPIDTTSTPRRSQTHPLAQMTPLSPPANILPSQPDFASPTEMSSPAIQELNQAQLQSQTAPKPATRPRGRQPKAASRPSNAVSMNIFLASLDTDTWKEVVAVRGASGVAPLLSAVREVLLGELESGLTQRVVVEMGALVGEAVDVLGRLEGGRGVAF